MKARNSKDASCAQSSMDRGRTDSLQMIQFKRELDGLSYSQQQARISQPTSFPSVVQAKNGPSNDSSGDSSAAGGSSNESSTETAMTGDLAAAAEIDREILRDLRYTLEMANCVLDNTNEELANTDVDDIDGLFLRDHIRWIEDDINTFLDQIDALETILSAFEQVAPDVEPTTGRYDPIEMHEGLLEAVQAAIPRTLEMLVKQTQRLNELAEAGDYESVSRLAEQIESLGQRLLVLQQVEAAIERVLPLIRRTFSRQSSAQ